MIDPLKNDCEKSALFFSRKDGLFECPGEVLVFARDQLHYQDRSQEECLTIQQACASFLRDQLGDKIMGFAKPEKDGRIYYHCILMEDKEGYMRVEGIPVSKASKAEQVGEIE